MTKSAPESAISGLIATVLALLAGSAICAPESVVAQTAAYYGAPGYQQYYGAPGYAQHPAASHPALRGPSYPHTNYPAAANAAAANRYGGTTAWSQPGFVAQPYANGSAFATPQQAYGHVQGAPGYGYNYGQQPYGQPYSYYGNAPQHHGHQYPNQQYPGHPTTAQPGQNPATQGHAQWDQHAHQQHQQLTPIQQAAKQAAQNVLPNGVPVLSPEAARFFQNLKGPNLSTYNQNRSNYSFTGQTRPNNQIPNTTWQSGSRYGQSYPNRSNYNQTTTNQNRFNYNLHNLTAPGFRGY